MDDKLPWLVIAGFWRRIKKFHGKHHNVTCEKIKLMQKFCTNNKEKIVTLNIILQKYLN